MSPAAPAARAHRVAVVGFSAFERDALQVFFRLAAHREPHYVAAPGLAECEFAIVDGDTPQAMHDAREAARLGDAVVIGAHWLSEPVLGHLPRPIDPLHIMRLLDLAVARRAAEHPAPGTSHSAAERAALHRPSGRALHAARRTGVRDFRSSRGFSNSVLAGGDEVLQPVLVVDDSPIARRFLESRLESLGYPVHGAESGEDAVQKATAQPYHLVFLDVNLPGIDGFETCRRLKQQAAERGLPCAVAFVTGRTAATDRVRATLAGGDAYLAKPLVEDDLRRVLAEHDDRFERVFEDTGSEPTLD